MDSKDEQLIIFNRDFCKKFAEELETLGKRCTIDEAHDIADKYADTVAKLLLDAKSITLPRLGKIKVKYVPPTGVVKVPSWRADMSWSAYIQRAYKNHIIDY